MSGDNQQSGQDFGANSWLVEEMYAKWLTNPDAGNYLSDVALVNVHQ